MKKASARAISSSTRRGSSSQSGARLKDKIKSGELKIAVYGLGHVGSPIAAAWLRSGAYVIGFDKAPHVLDNAKKGKTHVPEPGVNEAFTKGIKDKHFLVYDD